MKLLHALPVLAFTCAFAQGCGEAASDSVADVASESAKEVLVELKKEQDSIPPTPESLAHDRELEERAESSEFKELDDAGLEIQLRGWIDTYRNECDTQVFMRFKDAVSKDPLFQAWGRKNHELKEDLWKRMKSVRDSCIAVQ